MRCDLGDHEDFTLHEFVMMMRSDNDDCLLINRNAIVVTDIQIVNESFSPPGFSPDFFCKKNRANIEKKIESWNFQDSYLVPN